MNPTTIQVTETRVFPNPVEDERLKAFATVTLNGCFVVTDMKVINGNEGLFVAMPARLRIPTRFDRRFRTHPITHSDAIRPPIPDASDHSFRTHPTTDSGVIRPAVPA